MFPAQPGQTVDILRTRWHLALGEKAQQALARFQGSGKASQPLAEVLAATLRAQSPLMLAQIFSHPLASMDLSDEAWDETLPVRILRHLIGAPAVPSLTVSLTPDQLGDGLYLPHLHMTLCPADGQVTGILQQKNRLQLIRSDGAALTVNREQPLPARLRHPLVELQPSAGFLTVLNKVPEIRQHWHHLGLATEGELAAAIHRLESGLTLFRQVWPEAASALSRHVRSVVLLRDRGYQRSHSPADLCGNIFMTTSSPVMIGDLLAHEASHIRMHWFQACDPLILPRHHDPTDARFCSPWRPDPRPLNGLTLGIHAFLNVCEWYRRIIATLPDRAPHAPEILRKQLNNTRTALELLKREGCPTALGQQLMSEFDAAERGFSTDPCNRAPAEAI